MTDQALQRARELAARKAEATGMQASVAANYRAGSFNNAALLALADHLATPVTVTVEAAREVCHQHAMGATETDATIAVLRHLHLIGDGSGWARRVTVQKWEDAVTNAFLNQPVTNAYEACRQAARHFGFLTSPPDSLAPVKAAHPEIDPAVVESIAKMVGEKAS